jgi:hypothetical protein
MICISHSRANQRGVAANRHETWARDAMDAMVLSARSPRGRTTPWRTAEACGPGAPGLVLSAQDDDLRATVTMRSRTPGRARTTPLTPLRREGRVAPVEPVVTNSCAFFTAHEAAGATSIRSSLRPLISEGRCRCRARANCAAGTRTCVLFPSSRPSEQSERRSGTQPTGLRLLRRSSTMRASSRDSAVWVPAFAGTTPKSNRLARIRHRGGEAAVDRKRLAVDVRRLVARQK